MTTSSILDLLKTFNSTIDATETPWGLDFSPKAKVKDTITKNDVLALSARLYKEHNHNNAVRFMSFEDADSTYELTKEDVTLADAIADHFGKQIMMTTLREQPLSKFQTAVSSFLDSGRHSYNDETKGMIYRLPEFYEYDNDLAAIIDTNFSGFKKVLIDQSLGNLMTLKPIKALRKNLRSKDVVRYWFSEVDNNTPVMLELRHDNPLKYIWDHLFSTRATMEMSGQFQGVRHPSGFQYATSQKWKMEDL
jgi:hypothetical protein